MATGAHQSRKLDIPGEDAAGVMHGVDFLRKVALGEYSPLPWERGGGEGSSWQRRGGCRRRQYGHRCGLGPHGGSAPSRSRSSIAARATRCPPIRPKSRLPSRKASRFITWPRRSKCLPKVDGSPSCNVSAWNWAKPDSSGRRRPLPVKGSEFLVPADMLIPAVSQSSDRMLAEAFSLKTTAAGTIDADELTLSTSRAGIFAGGDVVAGPSSVIEAIAHGKRAATAINNYLAGRPLPEGIRPREARPNPLSPEEIKALKRKSPPEPRLLPDEIPVAQRTADFREVEQIYSAEQAQAEARRCLNCAACCECMQCVAACKAHAIDHDQQEKTIQLDVGAVVLTPGFEAFDAARRGEFGYGLAPNVLTSVQFERMLSASGPTQGHIRRPADGKAAAAAGLHPVRGLARPRLRQRLLLVDLLHGRHQGSHSGQGARAGSGSHHLLPRPPGLRQGFRSLLRSGEEPVGRALRPLLHLPRL